MQQHITEQEYVDIILAHHLLQQRGYALTCRFDHLHATNGSRELHLCLVADLASMHPAQFLACLEEAITQSLEYVLPLLDTLAR
jgi:hypothetical protein